MLKRAHGGPMLGPRPARRKPETRLGSASICKFASPYTREFSSSPHSVEAKLRQLGWGQEIDMLDPDNGSPLSKNKHIKGKNDITEESMHLV